MASSTSFSRSDQVIPLFDCMRYDEHPKNESDKIHAITLRRIIRVF